MFDQNTKQKIIVRAMKDEAFRQELLKNPKAVLEREFRATIATEVSVQVHEDTPTSIHLVLPRKAQEDNLRELSDTELEKAAGGPTGGNWMKELSDTELGQIAGGPTGTNWLKETPDPTTNPW